MTMRWWARVAAVASAATAVLFSAALVAVYVQQDLGRPPGPYAGLLRVVVVVAGLMVAVGMAWRYERLARGRFEGRPQWRVLTAWWAVVVITVLIVVSWPASPWAVAAWIGALAWGISSTRAGRLDRLAHP